MMFRTLLRLVGDRRGNAAVEMAMVTPLLLILMFGSVELGNYFWNEHTLLKAVRDGARFAARQGFNSFSTCSSTGTDLSSATVGSNTKKVVQKGSLDSTQPDLLPNWSTATFKLTATCATTQVGGQTMSGLYKNDPNGWTKVTVETTLTYRPVLAVALGFSGVGYQLYGRSEAAVTGL
jgi:Flp pilus assembly protein TadG